MLGVVSFLGAADRVAVSILLEPIKQEFVLSDSQLGLLGGTAFAVLYAVIGLPLAIWSDIGNRRKVIAWCVAIWSAMTALCGIAQSFTQLLLARVGVGIGEAGAGPAGFSMVADAVPRDKRPKAIALYTIGGYVGTTAGLAGAGWLADHLGWRHAFWVFGLPGIPVALLFLLLVREPRRSSTRAPNFRTSWTGMWQQPRAMIHMLLAMGSASLCTWGLLTFMPSFYMRSFGLTGTQVGLFLGVAMGLSTAVGTLAGGFLAQRALRRDVAWGAQIAAITTVLGTPLYVWQFMTGDVTVSLVVGVTGFVLGGVCVGPVMALLQDIVEPHSRALALALTGLSGMLLGQGLGPLALGLLSDALTPLLGAEALRYSLAAGAALSLWPAFHFWRLAVCVRGGGSVVSAYRSQTSSMAN